MEPWNKNLTFIFPTKYVIPKKLKRLAIGQVRLQGKFLNMTMEICIEFDVPLNIKVPFNDP